MNVSCTSLRTDHIFWHLFSSILNNGFCQVFLCQRSGQGHYTLFKGTYFLNTHTFLLTFPSPQICNQGGCQRHDSVLNKYYLLTSAKAWSQRTLVHTTSLCPFPPVPLCGRSIVKEGSECRTLSTFGISGIWYLLHPFATFADFFFSPKWSKLQWGYILPSVWVCIFCEGQTGFAFIQSSWVVLF